ncbi:MAG: hypothetical protein RL702_1756 [Pseudomonadota bacterium]|jgi:iron complex outermembrane receptor protein
MNSKIVSLRILLAASSALLPLAAHAQDVTQLPPVDADAASPVDSVSTAPVTGRELTRQDIKRRQNSTSDTGDLLRQLPGVSANSGGGFSSMPALRGLSEQRLRITVDGAPIDLSCPNDMNSPLSYTVPQTIESIRVVPGVAPVSMGGDNIGGIIAVESVEPRFSSDGTTLVTGEVSTFYRSNGDGFGGSALVAVANSNLSATYTGSYTEAQQYKAGGNLGRVRSTEYAKTDHALALALQSEAGLFRLKGGYHFSPYEGFANQAMDMVSNKSWFLNAGYDGEFDWGSVKFTADYRDTDHEMNFLEDKLPGAMPMNTEVHTFSTALKLELPVSARDKLRLGGEYHHQWLNDYWPPVIGNMMMGPNTFVNINEGTRDRFGGYAEWEAHWSDTLSSVIGARLDHVRMNTGQVQPYSTSMMNMADAMAADAFNAVGHKRTDNNWSASALVSYAPTTGMAIELGYAHKARSPNIYERYTWGRGTMASRMIGWYGDGNGYVGNLNLKPERADTVSAAIEFKGAEEAWSLRVSPYYIRADARYQGSGNDRAGLKDVRGGWRCDPVWRNRALVRRLPQESQLPVLRCGCGRLRCEAQSGQIRRAWCRHHRGRGVARHRLRGREQAGRPCRLQFLKAALDFRIGTSRRPSRWRHAGHWTGLASVLRIEDRASKVTRQRRPKTRDRAVVLGKARQAIRRTAPIRRVEFFDRLAG